MPIGISHLLSAYGRWSTARSGFRQMPFVARLLVGLAALPAILIGILSILLLLVSILALLLLTVPVYRLLSAITGSGQAARPQDVTFTGAADFVEAQPFEGGAEAAGEATPPMNAGIPTIVVESPESAGEAQQRPRRQIDVRIVE